MRLRTKNLLVPTGLLLIWMQLGAGCSTTEVAPVAPPVTAEMPVYLGAPHPDGYGVGDLTALMAQQGAPAPGFEKTCDTAVVRLLTLTPSQAELERGVRELVGKEPLHFHWCFYGKLAALHADLLGDRFIDQRQKAVLDTYAVLVPIARAFMSGFRDSRYLRWAVRDYRQVSEWVFFRRLELTPQETSELVEVANPFGAWKGMPAATSGKGGLEEKYGIQVEHPFDGKAAVSREMPPPPAASSDAGAGPSDRHPATE